MSTAKDKGTVTLRCEQGNVFVPSNADCPEITDQGVSVNLATAEEVVLEAMVYGVHVAKD